MARDADAFRMEISLTNQQQLLPVDAERMISAVRQIFADADYREGHVSLAVVDDATIQPINAQFLGHDYATDVLSFVLDESDAHLQGEIIVSAETALTNARDFDWPAQHELLLYVIHGALHLVGYNDKSDDETAAMRDAEAKYLLAAGVEPPANPRIPEGAEPR